jgi:protein-S-isoprenylcysteine O-methyltransferase Ste14
MKLFFKNLLFTVLVPGAVAGWLPCRWYWGRSEFHSGSWRWLAYPLIAVGAAIYLGCVWNFAFAGRGTPAPIDPPKALIVRGLYRYVRNPMYMGVLLVLLGELIVFPSRQFLVYILLCFLAVNIFVLAYEEPVLSKKFGAAYLDYRRRVPRWIPRLPKDA